jgi:uncharacterized protein
VNVRVLRPGDERALAAFLIAHVDSSLFLLRNLAVTALGDGDSRYHGTWAGAFEDGALVAVAQHSRFGSVLVQAPVHAALVTHDAVRASTWDVAGFIGPWHQALVARAALGWAEAPMRLESHEGLYALALDALKVPDALARGEWTCRPARRDEIDRLVDWRVAYNVESSRQTDGPELRAWSREEIERGLDEDAGWVLEVDGTPVAYQQFNAMLPGIVQVGGVWTPPPLRGRGYGRAVVAGALLAARAAGARRSVLFTDHTNVAARQAYAALGFERVGDWGLLFLRWPARPAFSSRPR